MKILLVVDGSPYSDISTSTLKALKLPPQTEVIVMTVVPEHTFLGGITLSNLRGNAPEKKKEQEEEATKILSGPVQLLSGSWLKVESLVRWGNPAQVILKAADELNASLIVMGAKGLTSYHSFRLGSVSQTVMKHARASVLLVRKKTVKASQGLQEEGMDIAIDRVLLATDGSKHSDMASKFLLDLPLPQQTNVVVITVLQSYIDTMLRASMLYDEDFKKNKELIADIQATEEREAQKIMDKSSQQFKANGYKTTTEIMRGAADVSILKAADEHDPDIIALGSRGLTGIESFLLGSVSERIARHAPCSVLIVKPPKV